jgi:hypothetical protein
MLTSSKIRSSSTPCCRREAASHSRRQACRQTSRCASKPIKQISIQISFVLFVFFNIVFVVAHWIQTVTLAARRPRPCVAPPTPIAARRLPLLLSPRNGDRYTLGDIMPPASTSAPLSRRPRRCKRRRRHEHRLGAGVDAARCRRCRSRKPMPPTPPISGRAPTPPPPPRRHAAAGALPGCSSDRLSACCSHW